MCSCPKCGAKLKFLFIENIFRVKVNNLRCSLCNTKIKMSKKSSKINSIISIIPLILIVFWGKYIINFITNFTQNNKISEWILIFIMTAWGTIIYNCNFPWDEFEEI